MRTITEKSPLTANEIFEDVKSNLKNPEYEVVTTNDVRVALDNVCIDFVGGNWTETHFLEKTIKLLNDYFDTSVTEWERP